MILDRLAAVPGRAAGAANRRPPAERPEPAAAPGPARPGRRRAARHRDLASSSSQMLRIIVGFCPIIVGVLPHHRRGLGASSPGRRRAAGERADSSALRRKIPADGLGKPVAKGYLARSQFSFKPPEVGAKPSFTT
ncbi:MAG: hypothetical protein ACJ8C3_25980 [Microvirga sp.]